MSEALEEKVGNVKQVSKDCAPGIERVKQAVEDAMELADDPERKVEIAKRVFEFALELPAGTAVFLGRVFFQRIDDQQTYYKIVDTDEFERYAQEYGEKVWSGY